MFLSEIVGTKNRVTTFIAIIIEVRLYSSRSTVAVKAMLKMECWKVLINDQDEEGYTPLTLACRIKGSLYFVGPQQNKARHL